MPRYIDAIAAQREIEIVGHERFLTSGDVDEVKLFLEEQPTADVAPVIHGHWIKTRIGIICSRCSWDWIGFPEMNFCPNCSAKMDEETEK